MDIGGHAQGACVDMVLLTLLIQLCVCAMWYMYKHRNDTVCPACGARDVAVYPEYGDCEECTPF